MAVINDPSVAANIQRVGEIATGATGAAHSTLKPIPTTVGAYRVTHSCALVATQAANSRLFEFRNTHATNLCIPTHLKLRWLQDAAHTAAIEDAIDAYKVTGFSVVDSVNTVTLTGSIKRAGMTAAPGNALLRGVTVAGAAAGMTGGTLTKDGSPFGTLAQWLLLAQPTAAEVLPVEDDLIVVPSQEYPFVFGQNEGFILENRVLLGAAAGSTLYIDYGWTEVTAY